MLTLSLLRSHEVCSRLHTSVLNTKHFDSVTVQSAFSELLEEMLWNVHTFKTVHPKKPHAFSVKSIINRNSIWPFEILTCLQRRLNEYHSLGINTLIATTNPPVYFMVCMLKCGVPYPEPDHPFWILPARPKANCFATRSWWENHQPADEFPLYTFLRPGFHYLNGLGHPTCARKVFIGLSQGVFVWLYPV